MGPLQQVQVMWKAGNYQSHPVFLQYCPATGQVKLWGLSSSDKCRLCGRQETNSHILSSYNSALQQGRYAKKKTKFIKFSMSHPSNQPLKVQFYCLTNYRIFQTFLFKAETSNKVRRQHCSGVQRYFLNVLATTARYRAPPRLASGSQVTLYILCIDHGAQKWSRNPYCKISEFQTSSCFTPKNGNTD